VRIGQVNLLTPFRPYLRGDIAFSYFSFRAMMLERLRKSFPKKGIECRDATKIMMEIIFFLLIMSISYDSNSARKVSVHNKKPDSMMAVGIS
jgi:hypothetical protein